MRFPSFIAPYTSQLLDLGRPLENWQSRLGVMTWLFKIWQESSVMPGFVPQPGLRSYGPYFLTFINMPYRIIFIALAVVTPSILLGAMLLCYANYIFQFLFVLIITPLFLFKILVKFPLSVFKFGWRRSFCNKIFNIVLFGIFIIYEAINLTGFSWRRMEFVSEREMIDTAIKAVYDGLYSNEAELKAVYSSFEPELSLWKSWDFEYPNDFITKWRGLSTYQVSLPNGVVILNLDGKVIHSTTPSRYYPGPNVTELGVIGSVEYENPPLEINGLYVNWSQNENTSTIISGGCFSTYTNNATGQILSIGTSDSHPTEIISKYEYEPNKEPVNKYGFFFKTIKLKRKTEELYPYYTYVARISKDTFLKYRMCDKNIKDDWSNVVK